MAGGQLRASVRGRTGCGRGEAGDDDDAWGDRAVGSGGSGGIEG